MKKLAIFVEGQTEQIFVDRLLREIAGERQLLIQLSKANGGRNKIRTLVLQPVNAPGTEQYYILINDCGQDERVASDVEESSHSLSASGHQAIIGLRDCPRDRAAIPALRNSLRRIARRINRQYSVHVEIILAVMEIEAWFLSEYTHFARIDPGLTLSTIAANVGFDPSVDNMELRDRPAEDLDTIYRLVGQAYTKGRLRVQRTVEAIDYAVVYLELVNRIDGLLRLVSAIDSFLSC